MDAQNNLKIKQWLVMVISTCFILLFPYNAFASGFRIETQGAKATGMGNAFVATADDPSAIFYNPAGLTLFKDTNLYLGATAVAPSTTFENTTGAKEETEDQVFFPPHFYIASDFGMERMSFGVGIYSPFGLGTKWSKTGLARYAATESKIETLNINPTVAYRILPSLSIGAGIDYMKSKALMDKMVNQSSVGGSDASLSLEGDGDGWGYNLGLLFKPYDNLSMGMSYRSGIKIQYHGTASLNNIATALQPLFGGASYRTNMDTEINFPDVLSLGIAYKPSDKLTVEIDAERVGWSSYDKLKVDLENEVALAGFTDSTEAKDWKDVWTFKAGIEYKATEQLSLRVGYAYENNPAPNHALEPRLPDSDQHDVSIGIGYQSGSLVIDAAYMAAFYEDRSVSNSILSGEYKNFAHFIGLSVGWRF